MEEIEKQLNQLVNISSEEVMLKETLKVKIADAKRDLAGNPRIARGEPVKPVREITEHHDERAITADAHLETLVSLDKAQEAQKQTKPKAKNDVLYVPRKEREVTV